MSVSELSGRSKAAIVVIVVLLATAGAVGYVLRARSAASSPAAAPAGAGPAGAPATPLPRETSLEPGSLLMVRAGPSADSGTVLAVPGRGESAARGTGLHCKRFYAAKGTALCLRVTTGLVTRSEAVVLDDHLREKRAVPLSGVPSRARVSASGRMAAWTFFVTGDSYLATGFSTRAGILDTRTGKLVKSLEDFTLEMDGRTHRAPDVNYWGVTFAADDNRFYATVSTGGRTYLIEGDFAARRMRTLRENAECPSLSPDGERLVYKKRTGDAADPWRLYTLDLRTGQEKALAETANVDDQAAWLDDRTVMYSRLRGDSSDVWTVPADGSGRPALLLRDAYSPAAT
ncbi:TolB family protein [Sphaerisporangium aureirubrum]|uniref:TolB family protein n=1 Tax=Sphaerisporangium aureirubrum TaxID=1544736 RepID=A0ABW1NAT5_9ACTN